MGSNNLRMKEVFGDSKIVLALKQPPNLLRLLSKASFNSSQPVHKKKIGIFKCNDIRCKLCALYMQPCKSFLTSNGTEWQIKNSITCESKNVIYYLKCIACKGATTYTGKTNNLRKRMNNHISSCRLGTSTDRFDNHVFKCRNTHHVNTEPYFEIYVFLSDLQELQAF